MTLEQPETPVRVLHGSMVFGLFAEYGAFGISRDLCRAEIKWTCAEVNPTATIASGAAECALHVERR